MTSIMGMIHEIADAKQDIKRHNVVRHVWKDPAFWVAFRKEVERRPVQYTADGQSFSFSDDEIELDSPLMQDALATYIKGLSSHVGDAMREALARY